MKKEKKYKINHKILLYAQSLLLIISVMLMSLLLLISIEQHLSFFDMIESNLIYNTFYVLSMFDAICFFEVFYIRKRLIINKSINSCLINILLISIVQFFLMNIIIGILLVYFVYKTLKLNDLSLKRILIDLKEKKEILTPIFNIALFTVCIVIVYIMIVYRFL